MDLSYGPCKVGANDCKFDPNETDLFCCNQRQNYFHLIGGVVDLNKRPNLYGWSYFNSDYAESFINGIEKTITENCSSGCSPDALLNLIRNNPVHELGHLFDINTSPPCDPTDPGHDQNLAWCGHATDIDGCWESYPKCKINNQDVQWCAINGGVANQANLSTCQRSTRWARFDCQDLSSNPLCVNNQPCAVADHSSIRTQADPQ